MSDTEIPTPRLTTALIGHEAAENHLLEAWNSGRMPHAWLLTGARGIGKATLAYRLARFVLASAPAVDTGPSLFGEAEPAPPPSGLDVDLDTPAARQVINGSHPDLMVIERSINRQTKKLRRDIVIEDVSALAGFLHLTPSAGGWRVVVVDSVDEMNRNAANAMLKLLEEPPKRAMLILVSHAPGGLLPTIRSRCRKLHLPPLREADVMQLLENFQPDLEPETGRLAARLSEGSIGRALEIAGGDGLVVLQDAVRLLDGGLPVDRRELHAVCEKWLRRGRGEDGDPLAGRLDLLLWWLGQGVRRLAQRQSSPAETIPGETRVFAALADRFGLDGYCARLDMAESSLRRGIGLNLDRKQIVTAVIRHLTD